MKTQGATSKSLHIILYSPFPNYSGGRESWLFNHIKELSSCYRCVHVYVFQSNTKPFFDLSIYKNVSVHLVKTLRINSKIFLYVNYLLFKIPFLLDSQVLFPKKVAGEVKRHFTDGDVIIAMNSIIEMLPAVQLRKELDAKIISVVHGISPMELSSYTNSSHLYWQRLENKMLLQADAIVANGYDTQSYLASHGIESIVVPNGVDTKKFGQPEVDDPELSFIESLHKAGKKLVVMVATLRPIKGISELLLAGQYLNDTGEENFKIVFIGKGDTTPYNKQAAELGVEPLVTFVGEKKNIAGWLYYADVVPCLSGGSGLALANLEAMAAGKPIVAWRTPVYTQTIEHLKDGLLVSPGDIKGLSEGIRLILEDDELANRLGSNAKAKAQKYDWKFATKKLIWTINEL